MKEEKDQFDLQDEAPRKKRTKRSSDRSRKAALPYRIIAWVSLAVICFGMGYFGTSLALKMLNKNEVNLQEEVVSSRESAEELLKEENASSQLLKTSGRKTFYKLYYPDSNGVMVKEIEFYPGLMEEDILKVVSLLSGESKTQGFLEEDFSVVHVFRTGEMLYLDLGSSFERSVMKMSKDKAASLMTSIVRTMVENFSPVKKVRILIEGRMPVSSLPVDLSLPWQLSY